MPIDPSIPLQSQGPAPITLGSITQMMQMKQQMLQQRQQQQAQNALLSIFQDPSNLDANGMPTGEAVKKISMVSPQMGMDLRNQQAKIAADQSLAKQRNVGMFNDKSQAIHDAIEPSIVAYDQARQSGLPDDQARIKAQTVYTDNLKNVADSGMFSPQEIATMPTNFDPDRVRAGAIKYKDLLGLREKEKSDERADKRLEASMEHSDRQFAVSEARLSLAEKASARAEANAVGAPGGKLDDDTTKVMAQQYLAGDTSVMTNLGRGRQGAENIVALRKEIVDQMKDAGMSGADVAAKIAEFGGIKAGERTLGTRTANVGMAVNEASQFADLALEASKEFPRTSFVPVNKAMVSYAENTGDPKVKAFGAANLSFINAYARAVSPTGTPTVSDKEHARDMLSTADGPEAYAAVMKQLQKEMKAANTSPGTVRGEFREAVTKDSKQGTKTVHWDDL